MLVDIKCSAVTSVRVKLAFDDQCKKDCLIAIGDLIDCEYNANGLRKHIIGKVLSISAVGPDPKGWYIIVDGSDDFDGVKARFSPMSILDVDILRKADMETFIETPRDDNAVPFLRIVKGRLQWSKDGYTYHPVRIDARDIVEDIEEQEGTMPVPRHCHYHHRPETPGPAPEDANDPDDAYDDAEIEDAAW